MDADGRFAPMTSTEAQAYFHLFVSITYFTPLLGALLADGLWGKYRTIISLSIVYCLGLFCLALDNTRTGLLVGQALIALGAGGIKPCVSAHVGDQFGIGNRHLLGKVFSWFYLTINLGAFIAMLLVPWLLKTQGAPIAFLVPGLLMLLATLLFWSGRYRFVHIPPAGMDFVREALSGEGLRMSGPVKRDLFVHCDVLGLIRPEQFILGLAGATYGQTGIRHRDIALADSSRQSIADRPAHPLVSPVYLSGIGQAY